MGCTARLIVNPAAGRDDAPEELDRINRRLRDRFEAIDIGITTGPGEARTIARRAIEGGVRHLLVAGGDGTLNEVLNGVADLPGGLQSATFGVLPLGTGNDFATALGTPDLDAALLAIVGGQTTAVDVGIVNGRYFVNVSAGGFIADVSESVSSRLKTFTGRLAYLIGGAQVLLDFEPFETTVEVTETCADAAAWSGPTRVPVHTFAVCNSRLIGGGRLIAPQAIVDDGCLDLCVITAMPAIEFVALLRAVSDGEHLRDPRVMYARVRQLDLTFDRPITINTDGEVLEADRVRYAVLPRAVRFFSSPGGQARPEPPADNTGPSLSKEQ